MDIYPFRSNTHQEGNKTLYKSDHLEVFRMILTAGKEFAPHKVAGEITLSALKAALSLRLTV
jgi:hypothetical protein